MPHPPLTSRGASPPSSDHRARDEGRGRMSAASSLKQPEEGRSRSPAGWVFMAIRTDQRRARRRRHGIDGTASLNETGPSRQHRIPLRSCLNAPRRGTCQRLGSAMRAARPTAFASDPGTDHFCIGSRAYDGRRDGQRQVRDRGQAPTRGRRAARREPAPPSALGAEPVRPTGPDHVLGTDAAP